MRKTGTDFSRFFTEKGGHMMQTTRRSVTLPCLLALASMLWLSTPAEPGGFWRIIGKAAVLVGTEFVVSAAKGAGTATGQEAAERLLQQYRPPQEGEAEKRYDTPHGTLSYQFQGYREGMPAYQAVLLPQLAPASALTCVTYVGWCPLGELLPHGAPCVCFTMYGNYIGIAQ
jgi:hypothetical protein